MGPSCMTSPAGRSSKSISLLERPRLQPSGCKFAETLRDLNDEKRQSREEKKNEGYSEAEKLAERKSAGESENKFKAGMINLGEVVNI